MENILDIGGGGHGNGDRLGGIVPGVDDEELFEFYLDQLMDANGDDRQEVVDYLTDEFDYDPWMVEGFAEFAIRDAAQDHQQVERDNAHEHEASKESARREYYRKRWQTLKANPVEYAKELKRMQDYRKRRMEQMTVEEKEAYLKRRREQRRNQYRNLSAEEKAKRIQQGVDWRRQKRLESEEYREKEREDRKKYRAKMTEQQKANKRAKDRERSKLKWLNMTEDERKVVRQKNAESKKRQYHKKMKKD